MTSITIGNSSPTVTSSGWPNDFMLLNLFPVEKDMTLTDIWCLPAETDATAKLTAVVYAWTGASTLSTAAGSLVAQATEVIGTTSGVAKQMTLVTPLALNAGDNVWIGFLQGSATGGTVDYKSVSATLGFQGYVARTYTSGPNATAGTLTIASGKPTVWGTGTTTDNRTTYGTTTNGDGFVNGPLGDNKVVTPITVGASVSAQYMMFWQEQDSAATTKPVIYDNTGASGEPGALVFEGTQLTALKPGWNKISLGNTVLTAGTWYIGLHASTTSTVANHYQWSTSTAALKLRFNSDTYVGGAANPFGSPSVASNFYAAFLYGPPPSSTITGTGAMTFGGIEIVAAANDHTSAGAMTFSGLAFSATSTVTAPAVRATGAMLFTKLELSGAGSRLAPGGTGLRQFWTFGI